MYEQDYEWYNYNKRKNKHFPMTLKLNEDGLTLEGLHSGRENKIQTLAGEECS